MENALIPIITANERLFRLIEERIASKLLLMSNVAHIVQALDFQCLLPRIDNFNFKIFKGKLSHRFHESFTVLLKLS